MRHDGFLRLVSHPHGGQRLDDIVEIASGRPRHARNERLEGGMRKRVFLRNAELLGKGAAKPADIRHDVATGIEQALAEFVQLPGARREERLTAEIALDASKLAQDERTRHPRRNLGNRGSPRTIPFGVNLRVLQDFRLKDVRHAGEQGRLHDAGRRIFNAFLNGVESAGAQSSQHPRIGNLIVQVDVVVLDVNRKVREHVNREIDERLLVRLGETGLKIVDD